MANIWRKCPSLRLRAGDVGGTIGGTAKNISSQFFGEDIVYYGILKRWTGSTFVKESMKVFTGSEWKNNPLKRWSGTAWLGVEA